MVGVLMRVEHGMDDTDPGTQKLRSQVGARVDEQIALG